MSASSRAVMLAALCLGVLLVGIELFITAVALPRILIDHAGWTELRRASWIINAYLVAYITAMPLAGRAADRFGLPRLVTLSLLVFAVGSVLCGAAQDLEQLVLARIVQGVGAGALLPLATAGASHLYEGHGRARALGFVGAATFLGMALGPVLGAFVLEWFGLRDALTANDIWGGPLVDLFTPSWRWVFYVTAPLALLAAVYVWAAAAEWDVPQGRRDLDVLGGVLFSVALAAGLLALTLLGDEGPNALPITAAAIVVAVVCGALAVDRMGRAPAPFLDLRLFRDRVFGSAVLVSVLTGYALATVIVGVAAFVDRVLFAGPEQQRTILGALALAMAVGAAASGFAMRRLSATAVTMAGLLAGVGGLVALAWLTSDTREELLPASLALFGFGFGLTVTPRSAAAVEAAGRAAFGAASAAVTVGRMVGMAVGIAVLTAFGTASIDAATVALDDQAFRDSVLPETLVGRPFTDPLVLAALETWAASEAARVLGLLFLVSTGVLLVAMIPAWLMRSADAARRARPVDELALPEGRAW
jgi:MFS family permease